MKASTTTAVMSRHTLAWSWWLGHDFELLGGLGRFGLALVLTHPLSVAVQQFTLKLLDLALQETNKHLKWINIFRECERVDNYFNEDFLHVHTHCYCLIHGKETTADYFLFPLFNWAWQSFLCEQPCQGCLVLINFNILPLSSLCSIATSFQHFKLIVAVSKIILELENFSIILSCYSNDTNFSTILQIEAGFSPKRTFTFWPHKN